MGVNLISVTIKAKGLENIAKRSICLALGKGGRLGGEVRVPSSSQGKVYVPNRTVAVHQITIYDRT